MSETTFLDPYRLPRWSLLIGCLKGAMQSGRVDIVRLAAEPIKIKSLIEPALGYYRSYLEEALKYAKNWEVYKALRAELPVLIPDTGGVTDESLRHYTICCRLDIIQRLVECYGIHVRHFRGAVNDYLLVNAARFFHEDIVEFLLDHGADPNEGEGTKQGSALSAAAAAESLSIVWKLLDRGARVGGKDFDRALTNAPHREHTSMVELLLDRDNIEPGAQIRVIEGKVVKRPAFLKLLRNEGLESMAELLESRGVTR
ncbi:hypothetical protein BX600DRAFT_442611 [Xylariales sp. PMI_506]|nr:hypothetical protein BX600DRAFT_442611 [Xylariales sp. PMI_506]